ncbi:uncharacterized protein BXZ73DRAFT_90097 [Epithele typhae]|uniref:uncharacterized protein n=1 Tax=Epithele typhae TaxID=378194 RepID=UPI0020081820|nr:uncharacterized protein BXZ73DRAFT_90097 [Epithele typhae]KAH9931670.1 hypothetical protein BXZ73DRAFT_90097 [Epithele typhae]
MSTTALAVHPQPSPVCRLPPELLIHIFVHCSDPPSDQLTLLVLGQVCRHWREVSHISPRIWQHIYLCESNGTSLSHNQALRWMQNASPLPVDAHICTSTTDMILPLMSPLMSDMRRLERCVISGRHEEEFKFFEHAFDPARTCLVDELGLLIKGSSALDPLGLNANSDTADDRPFPNIFQVHCPSEGPPELAFHFSLYALPLPFSMYPIPVKSLSITEFSLDVTTDIPRMLAFLRCTPALEILHFAGWPQEGDPIQPGKSTLTVSVRAILAHLHAPALRELYLEHTNVDFELRTEPYVHAQAPPEDGESDDEAHDFSQSPWSDHATGMGLRALLRRSQPPLEVLHMDYTDLRTKDFRWVFEHLPLLREFRIVGSDMSDRVVAMLAPFRLRLAGDGLRIDDNDVWTVRVPRLQRLEVWHCQRISGDAVVRALRARVAFTDLAAQEGWGNTLENITIVGCADFVFQHAEALEASLGQRLRLS